MPEAGNAFGLRVTAAVVDNLVAGLLQQLALLLHHHFLASVLAVLVVDKQNFHRHFLTWNGLSNSTLETRD